MVSPQFGTIYHRVRQCHSSHFGPIINTVWPRSPIMFRSLWPTSSVFYESRHPMLMTGYLRFRLWRLEGKSLWCQVQQHLRGWTRVGSGSFASVIQVLNSCDSLVILCKNYRLSSFVGAFPLLRCFALPEHERRWHTLLLLTLHSP